MPRRLTASLTFPVFSMGNRFRPGFAGLSLLLLGFVTAGCTQSALADRMIRAPNQQQIPDVFKALNKAAPVLNANLYSLATKVPVGPPAAELAVAVLEPGDYKLDYTFNDQTSTRPDGSSVSALSFNLTATVPDPGTPPVSPKGTLFLLHGVMMTKESMLHWAFFLAQKGYRIVLVDLRGHGASTGDTISFGARETSDLSQVLDELMRRKLVAGPIGVLGVSYGGAIAIQWAAREPRIDAAVALAPYSDAREAIQSFARAVLPKVVDHISPETMGGAFALAAQRGNFTWEQTDALAAAKQLRFPILFLHGMGDTWLPIVHSERIRAAAPAGSKLLRGQGDHQTISIRLDPIAEPVAEWFDQRLLRP